MPDFFGVYHNIKVYEYLLFFARLFGVNRESIEKDIDKALELTNLTGKKFSYTNHLSRGMKQRLYIAKLLVHRPDILILDEPASGLDPHARIELRDILKQLQEEGKTIFISSRILSELADICTEVGILELGNLKFTGSVDEAVALTKGIKKIIIKIIDPGQVDKSLNIIKTFNNVINVKHINNLLNIDFKGTETDYYSLISELVNNNIPFVPVQGKVEALETAFKEITKGEVI